MVKMSPVFSPDGSRIAYTTSNAHNEWDTWVVPVLGGEPRRWLPNASGLIWTGRQKLLFSEKIRGSEGNHMKIVAADESRADARDLYVPMPKGAMAHRSYPSPDGRWALVAEMTDRGVWTPCRLVPMDASSPGRHVGPPDAACWFAGWSPDGAWMYFSSSAGNAFHAWRQRFSAGDSLDPPEQVTSGPTEEEGLAIAPDGRSFITAVGMKRRSVWVHDSKGERAVSLEGYALNPTFTPDGKKLVYFVVRGRVRASGRVVDRRSGHGSQRASAARFFRRDRRNGLGEIAVRRLAGRPVGGLRNDRHERKEHALAGDARPPIAAAPDPECRRGRAVVRSKRRRPVPRPRSRLWLCVPCPPGRHRPAESPRASGHRKHGPSRRTGGGSRFTLARSKERAGGTILLPVGGGTPVPVYGTGHEHKVVAGWKAPVHDGVRTDVRGAGSARPAAARKCRPPASHPLRTSPRCQEHG